jgi:hypothetical protein
MAVTKITAWSFSRWAAYEECPAKAKYKFIDKLPEPQGEALARGEALHTLCEHYLRGIKKTVPKDVTKISTELKDFRKRGALPEAEFAFNREWQPVSWFDRSAWCRVKADVTIPPLLDDEPPTVEVHDFKSGAKLDAKTDTVVYKSEYPLQTELYSLAGLLTYQAAEQARSSLVFIDHGRTVVSEEVFTQKDVKDLKKRWEMRTKKMLADTVFKPKPGNGCRWCNFSRSKGGPCAY